MTGYEFVLNRLQHASLQSTEKGKIKGPWVILMSNTVLLIPRLFMVRYYQSTQK